MPDIAFHTGLADPSAYACRLLRKAWRQGARVVVTGSGEVLNRLDVLLWTFEPDEFLPHARQRGQAPPDPSLKPTPVWLADDPRAWDDAAEQVLVNLGPDLPAGFERYARVIELVGEAPDDVQAGRSRWRQYVSMGIAPRRHEAAASEIRGVSPGSPD